MDNNTKHIPFAVIVAATNGDEAAIQEILNFYDGYISKLSLRKLYDEFDIEDEKTKQNLLEIINVIFS